MKISIWSIHSSHALDIFMIELASLLSRLYELSLEIFAINYDWYSSGGLQSRAILW